MPSALAGSSARHTWARRHPAQRVAAAGLALVLAASASVHTQEAAPAPGRTSGAAETGPRGPRLAVGGDVSLTWGPEDPHYFNFTDYYQNALRLFVGSVGASWAMATWLDAVGEVRVENDDRVRLSALYARARPWRGRPLTVAAGRVPPVFGAFSRTRYGGSNPLVSRPLAYQYLSTLRYDLVPPSADALLAVRGRGWLVSYPASPTENSGYQPAPGPSAYSRPAAGVPLVSTSRWDTGVVAHLDSRNVEVAAGVTVGSLSDPRVDDNNGGKQVVARLEWRPTAAWSLGTSAAAGAFVSRAAAREAGAAGTSWPQRAVAVDAAFARDHLQVRGEVIVSSWEVPAVSAPRVGGPLKATASTIEAQYRVLPRLDAAARADWIRFSAIRGSLYGGRPTPWDADVSRLEVGASYRVARAWRLKLAYQHNWRWDTARVSRGYPVAQLSTWF